MKETVELIIAQIKMRERTYDFAVGETSLHKDKHKEEILKALKDFTEKVERETTLEQTVRDIEREIEEEEKRARDAIIDQRR